MPTPYFGTLTYFVSPGDTLFNIAHNYNTSLENILKFNNIPNTNLIYPGNQLVVTVSL